MAINQRISLQYPGQTMAHRWQNGIWLPIFATARDVRQPPKQRNLPARLSRIGDLSLVQDDLLNRRRYDMGQNGTLRIRTASHVWVSITGS